MKVINITGLQYTKIATCPWQSSYGGTISGYPYGCIINGKFAVIYPGQDSNPNGIAVYLFDEAGNICTFKSYGWNNSVTQLATSPSYASSNFFYLIGNTIVAPFRTGAILTMQIPNVFIPGATFYIQAKNFAAPPSPCGGGDFTRSIYLAAQGVTAYEYIQAFPESNNYWASVYNTSNQLIGGGFLGNSPNDPFFKFQQTLPPYVYSSNGVYKGGQYFYSNMNSVGYALLAFAWNTPALYGDPSKLVCGGGGNSSVYVGSASNASINASSVGIPGTNAPIDNLAGGNTDLKNTFVIPWYYFNQAAMLVGNNYFITLNTPAGNSCAVGVYIAAAKRFYIMIESRQGGRSGDVYMTSFDSTPYDTPPVVSQTAHRGLVNWHRPISLSGDFLT